MCLVQNPEPLKVYETIDLTVARSAIHDVAFAQQKMSEIGACLTGNSKYQGFTLRHRKTCG
jgi:hypothetical protein